MLPAYNVTVTSVYARHNFCEYIILRAAKLIESKEILISLSCWCAKPGEKLRGSVSSHWQLNVMAFRRKTESQAELGDACCVILSSVKPSCLLLLLVRKTKTQKLKIKIGLYNVVLYIWPLCLGLRVRRPGRGFRRPPCSARAHAAAAGPAWPPRTA